MKRTIHKVLSGLLLGMMLSGCTFAPPNKVLPIASVTGSAKSKKPDDQTLASVYAGIVELLQAKGFQFSGQQQPSAHTLTGHPIYGDGFLLGKHITGSIELAPKYVSIEFAEWESPAKSGIFPATDEQRATVRALARDMEAYLRAHLPASYAMHVTVK